MAEDRMAVLDTLRKAIADGDVDFLREGVRLLAQALMDAEPGGVHAGSRPRVGVMSVRLAVCLDMLVAVLLIVACLSIPLAMTHVALGVAFAMAVAVHLVASRKRLRVNGRHRHAWSRRHRATLMLVTLVAVMTASGAAQWAGVAVGPMTALHATSSFGVFVLAGRHVWHRRRSFATGWSAALLVPCWAQSDEGGSTRHRRAVCSGRGRFHTGTVACGVGLLRLASAD